MSFQSTVALEDIQGKNQKKGALNKVNTLRGSAQQKLKDNAKGKQQNVVNVRSQEILSETSESEEEQVHERVGVNGWSSNTNTTAEAEYYVEHVSTGGSTIEEMCIGRRDIVDPNNL